MARNRTQILVVDDDQGHRSTLATLLSDWGHRVTAVVDGESAVDTCKNSPFDLVLMDVRMTGISGIDALKAIRVHNPAIPIIIMTAYSDVSNAVEALKAGAYDYLTKPLDFDELKLTLERAAEHLKLIDENSALKKTLDQTFSSGEVIGQSPQMHAVFEMVSTIATSEATVLITGESGTGKEVVAKMIHANSNRKNGPYIAVNCAALTETLLESELFGHERGSFTDAYESRPGKFEAASGSSLFMDEIGNLPLAMQAKLLTVLQNRKITRIGSNKVIPVDIRLLSATNKNIQEMVDSGTFREDLLYRLNTIHLEIPPLRERGNDIHLFIDYFMQRYAAKYEKKDISLHEHALEKLCSYHWPGNIRELQHAIEKAIILCEGNVIRPKDIFVKQTWNPQFSTTVPNLEEVERQAIAAAIRQNDGNLTATAEQLGISRQTLYNKIKRFKL